MLHRASSPSIIRPPTRPIQRTPPALPEKSSRHSSSSSAAVPPVPPPLSAPRPPKNTKESSKKDHDYENTTTISGTNQHVVKNINIEANRAKFTALMRSREEPGGSSYKCDAAAYENVNVEHISRLTALGFAQDAVIRALGITRNDLEMACDILNEFATKFS